MMRVRLCARRLQLYFTCKGGDQVLMVAEPSGKASLSEKGACTALLDVYFGKSPISVPAKEVRRRDVSLSRPDPTRPRCGIRWPSPERLSASKASRRPLWSACGAPPMRCSLLLSFAVLTMRNLPAFHVACPILLS